MNIKFRVTLLLLFCFPIVVLTKNIDSLMQELERTVSVTKKVDILNELSWEYNRKDLVLTKEFAKKALELAESEGYDKGKAKAYSLISIVESSFGNDLKAIEYDKKALALAEKIKDDDIISSVTNDLGNLYIYADKYDLALTSYLRSLSISKKQKDIEGISATLYNIALIYLDLGNNDKAIEYLEEAYKVGIKSKKSYVRSGAFFYKAMIYSTKKEYDKAIEYENKSLKIALENNDKWSAGYSYMGLGYYYKEKHELEKSEEYYKTALKYALDFGDKAMLGNVRASLSDVYSKQKKYKEAIYHGELAQVIFSEFEQEDTSTWYLSNTLATAYAGVGDYEKAYQFMKEYNELRDTMVSKDNRALLTKMEAEYKISEKEAENVFLKNEQSKSQRLLIQQRLITIISILLLVTIAVLAGVLYYNSIQRKKNIELLEEKVQERTRTLAAANSSLERFNYIASHDLKEPLRSISSFTVLLSRHLDTEDKTALKYMDFIKRNSNRMYELVGAMLEVSRYKRMIPNFEIINTNQLIDEVKEGLSKYIQERNATIHIRNLPNINADASLLSIVFQNLILNGIKYNESKKPQINITAENDDNEVVFHFKDNGIGIDEAYQKQIFEAFKRLHHYGKYAGTGIGLFISNDIISLHNGRIWVETNPEGGSIFKIALPK